MRTSIVDKELMQYFSRLNEPQKKSLLAMIKNFLTSPSNESPNRISIEQYNKELDEAEAEFEKGEYITHEQIKKKIKQW